jgi:predicted aspartyl protease
MTDVLAAYDRATHSADVTTIEQVGTLSGDGLKGTFHLWRDGDRERDDEKLGARGDTTLRVGNRMWERNASGDVRELRGFVYRRTLTGDFIDSGAFLQSPERARFLGYGHIDHREAWRIEVTATGGEPETLWIDTENGLPLRLEYLDGDGPTTIDFSDWRTIEGRRFPFRSVISDGDHAFDVVQQTTSITLDHPISGDVFAPLMANTLQAESVQTVPLLDRGGHIACEVSIAGKNFTFLIDTGAQDVLLDSSVARAAGLKEEGAFQVFGATRAGGLHVVAVPELRIGTAALHDLVVSSLDLGGSTSQLAPFDGILGYPFFASAVVELDFANHTMRFGPPGSFVPRGERIALDLDRELVEANFRIDNYLDAPFIVDTGNSGELLIYHSFSEEHPGLLPFSGQRSMNYGIGGGTGTMHTQVDVMDLGDIPLYHREADMVLASQGAFADRIDAGNVGLGTLRNFVVTFDLGNHAMYLERSTTFDDGRHRTVMTQP